MKKLQNCALTIAGSDSCGGAGIQADLKTFALLGMHGASVLSSVTAQNTLGVTAVKRMPDELILAQLEAVFSDLPVRAVKTGMLPGAESIELIARFLHTQQPLPALVIDPVLTATSGPQLSSPPALAALRKHLFPIATLVTPNLHEASALTGRKMASIDDMMLAGEKILESGCRAVLMKGGHLGGDEISDLLITAEGVTRYTHPFIPGSFHGTGCTLSAAITAGLAGGLELQQAVANAIEWVQSAIKNARAPVLGVIGLLGLKRANAQ